MSAIMAVGDLAANLDSARPAAFKVGIAPKHWRPGGQSSERSKGAMPLKLFTRRAWAGLYPPYPCDRRTK
jgi:hypothetical protein